MKKFFSIILAGVLMLAGIQATADNKVPIKKSDLPAEAVSFLDKHFASDEIALVIRESSFLKDEYEVKMGSGTDVDFDKNGVWKSVKCYKGVVPDSIVPEQIKSYIAEVLGNQKIMKIEKDRDGWEVKLDSDIEIEFNSDFKVIEFD